MILVLAPNLHYKKLKECSAWNPGTLLLTLQPQPKCPLLGPVPSLSHRPPSSFTPLVGCQEPGWSFLSLHSVPYLVNSPWDPGVPSEPLGRPPPASSGHPCPLPGGQGLYLLVQEQVPSQEAVLPAQQDPIPGLRFSPAAGLRYLVAVQCQESENGCQLEVFRPVDPAATKLGGEHRKGLWAGAGLQGRGGQTASPKASEEAAGSTRSAWGTWECPSASLSLRCPHL